MRIAINAMFWGQPNVGSGQYLHGLISGLTQVAPEHEYILLLPAFRAKGGQAGGRLRSVSVHTPFDQRHDNLAKLWFEQFGVPRAAARLHSDLLHVPYFAPPLASSVPVIASVLDLIPLLLPEYRGGPAVRGYMRLVALAARRAQHVLAISDASRNDIMVALGCAPGQVTTTHLAAGAQYRPLDRVQAAAEVAERFGIQQPYVYYVGGLDARKNVPTLLRAWARMRQSGGPAATLALAGRALGADPQLFPDLDRLIAELGIANSVARIDVSQADNPLLYNAATAFAFPSRYEGFGLPPLEAMACGTPAVVADASSLPEVVGGAALLVAQDDVAGWADALWRLLCNPALRADLSRHGLERAAQFSYARTAQRTLNVYQQAIGHAP